MRQLSYNLLHASFLGPDQSAPQFNLSRRRSVLLSLTNSYGRTGMPTGKLQALVYDILPLEEGAWKRCSECGTLDQLHTPSIAFEGRCKPAVLGVWISYYTFESVATTLAESPSSSLSTVVGLVRSTPLTECRPGPRPKPKILTTEGVRRRWNQKINCPDWHWCTHSGT